MGASPDATRIFLQIFYRRANIPLRCARSELGISEILLLLQFSRLLLCRAFPSRWPLVLWLWREVPADRSTLVLEQ